MAVSRRNFLKASLATGIAAGAGRTLMARETAGRPNVLFIMTDQQPVSTIGAYGNKMAKTPYLDRLAREGLRFDNCHISAFPCSPSRACFFTGQYPYTHGVVINDVPLREDIPSMGNIFKAAGYQTAYVGKWHLGGRMYVMSDKDKWSWKRVPDPEFFKYENTGPWRGGEDEAQCGFTDKWIGGWKHYHEYLRKVGLGEILEKYPRIGNHNIAPSAPEGQHMYSLVPEEHHMSAFLAGEAEKFIKEERDPNKPFCMVLSFYGPHLPVAPPRPWDTLYDPADVPLPENHEDRLKGKPLGQRMNFRCYKLPFWQPEQFKDYVARYWGYCAYIDKQIGRVLKALDDKGLTNDTIVVFTSDHGDMVTAHGFIFKLGSCGYDELMRVPFLMRYPRLLKRGGSNSALVESIDALPTLLSFCGMETPKTVQGRSFRELAEGKTSAFRDVVHTHTNGTMMVRERDWKYAFSWHKPDVPELYDMRERPMEMNNHATDLGCGQVLGRMKKHVSAWLDDTKHPYAKVAEKVMDETFSGALTPRVASFEQTVGEKGETFAQFDIEWDVGGKLSKEEKYWCFLQVIRPGGRKNPIVTRDTKWPDPPTTEWPEGSIQKLLLRVPIPEKLPEGTYMAKVGLYNPERRSLPPLRGAHMVVGLLEVRKENGKAVLTFKPVTQ